jgi:hypothetical protein
VLESELETKSVLDIDSKWEQSIIFSSLSCVVFRHYGEVVNKNYEIKKTYTGMERAMISSVSEP